LEIWPSLSKNLKSDYPCPHSGGIRYYFFRYSSRYTGYLTVQFTPGEYKNDSGYCGAVSFTFDSIQKKFFVVGGWNVFGKLPSDCLKEFCKQFKDNLVIRPLPIIKESIEPGPYAGGFPRR